MATTWWVCPIGNDTDGRSHGNAKTTFAGVIPLLGTDGAPFKGDTINVCASHGALDWTLSTTGTSIPANTKGTSFTDYGALIRGVTSAGDPALATVQAGVDSTARTLIRINQTAGYVTFRNIVFDSTPIPADTASHNVCTWHNNAVGGGDPGPVRFEGCKLLGANLGTRPSATRIFQTITATADTPAGAYYIELEGCYVQNFRGELFSGANLAGQGIHFVDYCVFYNDWTALASPSETIFGLANDFSASANLRFKNNHVYMVHGNNVFGAVIDFNVTGTPDVGTVDAYNNVVFCDSTSADPDIRFFGSGTTVPSANAGTIDYNVLVGGPNTAVGDIDDAQLWYFPPWNAPSDPKPNDIVTYSTAEATIFNAPGSTYAWDPLGNGVTITLPKDLRLKAPYDALGVGGVLRGALPGLGIDMVVDIATSDATPLPGEAFTITVTASCTGAVATGVTYTAQIPSGIQFLSATPEVGSYTVGDGVWTVGTLTPGFPRTLELVVRSHPFAENTSATFLAAVTAFAPSTDTNLANNTDSVTVMFGTLEKTLGSEFSNEKILASETSNEKVLASQTSTEKVVLP